MSAAGGLVDHVVRHGLAPELKVDGYARQARNFRRSFDDITHVVGVLSGSRNFGGVGNFTVALAISVPQVDAILGEKSPPTSKPREWQCTFGKRLGTLRTGDDKWWQFDHGSQPDEIAADVVSAWREFGKPFMDFATTLRTARDLMAWHEAHRSAAAASLLLGELDAARDSVGKVLAHVGQRNPRYHDRIVEWAASHHILPEGYPAS
jgi:hypothetical protein